MFRKVTVWLATHRIRGRGWAIAPILAGVLGLIVAALQAGSPPEALLDAQSGALRVQGLAWALAFVTCTIVLGAIGNECHRRVIKRAGDRKLDPSKLLENHDLTYAVGFAIQALLEDAADPRPGDRHALRLHDSTRRWIRQRAETVPKRWQDAQAQLSALARQHWDSLREPNLWRFIQRPDAPNLTDEGWYKLLRWINLGERLPFELGDPDGRALIGRLRDWFGRSLWEILKNDAVGEGFQAEAMHLALASQLLRSAEERTRGNANVESTVRAMCEEWSAHSRVVEEKLEEIGGDASATLSYVRGLHDGILGLHRKLDDLRGTADEIRTNQAAHHGELIERLDEIQAIPLAPFLAPTTNLGPEHQVRNLAFVGRSRELEELHARLTVSRAHETTRPEAVVHAIPGEGGIGKTQLVLAYALRNAAHWPHRWWLDGSAARFDVSCKELANLLKLGLSDNASGAEVRAALVGRFSHDGKHLLVIDNAEPRVGSREPWRDYEQLILHAPSRVLLTTRFTDRLTEFAEPFELGVLSPDDARGLLRNARAALRDGHSDGDLDAIAKHQGYLGLALGYASAWLTVHVLRSPAELLALLEAAEQGATDPLEDPLLAGRAAKYERSTAAALSLHLSDLCGKPALDVATAAAFCDPERISAALLAAVAFVSREAAEEALNLLRGRSMISLSEITDPVLADEAWSHVSLHRVTQSMLRRRAWSKDRERTLAILSGLHRELVDALRVTHHVTFSARVRATPHASALSAQLDVRLADFPPRNAFVLDQFAAAVLHHRLAVQHEYSGDLASALMHIDAAIRWGEHQGDHSTREIASWRKSRASVRKGQGDLKGALEDITFSIEWAQRQRPVDEQAIADRRASRAGIRKDQGDLKGALEDITFSIEWGLREVPADERAIAVLRGIRATIRQDQGGLKGALEDITFSIEWEQRQTIVDERVIAIRRAIRASIRQAQGDLTGALEDVTFSLEWDQRQTPVDERAIAVRRATRASIRKDQGDLDGALEDITSSIQWGQRQIPVDERAIAIDRGKRAGIRKDQGDLDGALEDVMSSIEWGQRQTPVDERAIAILRASRASIRRVQGDLKGALDDITFSIEWAQRQTPVDERSIAIDCGRRADIRQAQGDLKGALDDITVATEWAQRQTPLDERSIAILCTTRASIRQAQGDLKGALDDITFAIEWGQDQTPADERSIAIRRVGRARIRQAQGDLRGALDDVDCAIMSFETLLGPQYYYLAQVRGLRNALLQTLDGSG